MNGPDAARRNPSAAAWLDSLGRWGRADGTIRGHVRNLNALFEFLLAEGGVMPEAVDFRHLVTVRVDGTVMGLGPINATVFERFLAWHNRSKTDPDERARCRNNMLSTLRMFFRSIVTAGVLAESPLIGVKPAKVRVRLSHRRNLTPAECSALLQSAATSGQHSPRDVAIVATLLLAGVRPGELCGVTKHDLQFGVGVIMVNGKTGSRGAPMPPALAHVLERYVASRYYRERQIPTAHLFCDDRGQQAMTTGELRQLIKLLCGRAEIDRAVTTYWTRHTFATSSYRAGVSFPLVSQALGHTSIKNTHVYVHAREDRMRRIVESGPASGPLVDSFRAYMKAPGVGGIKPA